MTKADVAGVDESSTAACQGSQSQLHGAALQTGTRERSLREDDGMAALSARSAAGNGADKAFGVEGLRGAEASEQAGAKGKDKVVVGYWREHSILTHVIIRNAGHMVWSPPHLLGWVFLVVPHYNTARSLRADIAQLYTDSCCMSCS